MKKIIYFLLLFPVLALAQTPNQYGDGTGRASGSITTQNLNPLTGVPTAGSFVRLDLANQSTLGISVSGTYTGALSVQFTQDGGSTWVTVTNTLALSNQTSAAKSATIASASVGLWTMNVSGWESVRVTALAAVTGTASVRLRAVGSGEIISFDEPLPPGTNNIGSVSQALGSAATRWFAQLSDGTNSPAVKAASTAAATTDPSLVMQFNPVQPSNTNPFLVVKALPESIPDVASAAITTTTTTSAFTPTRGLSYQIVVPVTVVSGTTPTLDLSVEESDDGGTNWFTVYQFPRITATGIYRSPRLSLTGNRVRYVQTIAGTTPSFTRAINRLQSSDVVPVYRQLVDRSITLTTLNSTTPALVVGGAINFTITLKLGAATTPPVLQMEGSDDGGLTYYSIGNTLTGVASSSVSYTVSGVSPTLVRARVSTAGATVTADNLVLRAF